MAYQVIFLTHFSPVSHFKVNIIKYFLNLRKERVVLNGQHSVWVNIEAGVPQDLF